LDNTDALAYFALGVFKSLQGDYTGSIGDFTTSIRLKPDDAKGYLNRALSKLKIKDISGACEDFHKAHELGNKEAEGYSKQYCN
jgi:tetratricopeptide (TPR) repeat protein